jgi:hypothetical protein
VLGYLALDLLQHAGAGQREDPVRLREPRQAGEVMVVGREVGKRIDAEDRVEELGLERQAPGVGVDGRHAIGDAGIGNPLLVLGRAEPQVRRPHLHAELAREEDRLRRPTATEIEHAHPGLQLDDLGEPLGQPQRVGAAADARDQPIRVVARGAREQGGEEPGIHRYGQLLWHLVELPRKSLLRGPKQLPPLQALKWFSAAGRAIDAVQDQLAAREGDLDLRQAVAFGEPERDVRRELAGAERAAVPVEQRQQIRERPPDLRVEADGRTFASRALRLHVGVLVVEPIELFRERLLRGPEEARRSLGSGIFLRTSEDAWAHRESLLGCYARRA